jgi:cytochrome c oxidase subunit II
MDLIVQSSEDFQSWVKQQQAPLPTLSGDAAAGEQVFLASACVSCHAIDGTKAKGKVGPNLTHFGSRQSLGAKVAANTPENLANWLANPSDLKPGVLMPNLGLSADKIKALVAYLTSLK